MGSRAHEPADPLVGRRSAPGVAERDGARPRPGAAPSASRLCRGFRGAPRGRPAPLLGGLPPCRRRAGTVCRCARASWRACCGARRVSIPLLELAASRLGELADELVFVGGATITLSEPGTVPGTEA